MNPAREVKTERFSRTEGKTPAFVEGEVQRLLEAVETSTHTGLRDRALLGVLAYTFARIGAVVNVGLYLNRDWKEPSGVMPPPPAPAMILRATTGCICPVLR
jgi:site-specific recombinase XerD